MDLSIRRKLLFEEMVFAEKDVILDANVYSSVYKAKRKTEKEEKLFDYENLTLLFIYVLPSVCFTVPHVCLLGEKSYYDGTVIMRVEPDKNYLMFIS